MRSIVRCLWIAASLALIPASVLAATSGFYNGKTVTFIIGSAAGGGYDTYSRLLASHLGRHLEGGPTVVAQNMPGAGSIRAANYLYNVARKDGTAIGMLDEAIYLNQILGTPELRADATKFNWIGRILANSAVLFARRLSTIEPTSGLFLAEALERIGDQGKAQHEARVVLQRIRPDADFARTTRLARQDWTQLLDWLRTL